MIDLFTNVLGCTIMISGPLANQTTQLITSEGDDDSHVNQPIENERFSFFLSIISPIIQEPRPDLLRFNSDHKLFHDLLVQLLKVDLQNDDSRKTFQEFCIKLASDLNATSLHSDYFFGVAVFKLFSETALFYHRYDQSIDVALVRKSFLKELSLTTRELFNNYLATKNYLHLKNIPNINLTIPVIIEDACIS